MSANQINMTEGPIFSKLLKFSIPLIFSSVLQLFFNAADVIVVGRFSGDNSLAAVGSTGSLINLMVNLFVGLSIGTNVVTAHFFGAGKKKEVKETIHTAILLSIFSGIILTILGVTCTRQILTLMKSPEEVLVLASIYLKIYFGGITSAMIYNFGSAILRAKGDTQRPLYILFLAGLVNVILNLIFVIYFHMDVAGVALATIISQTISAVLVIILLVKEKDEFKLNLNELDFNFHIFIKIVKIGIPAGFQGILFSASNVIIQTSINSFGAIMMAGNSAAINLEGFVYTAMNGFSQGALTFTSQNAGAGKFDRIKKVTVISQLSVFAVGFILSLVFLIFVRQLLGIFSKNPSVIDSGVTRLLVILSTYFLCGMMDSLANTIRGMGHSLIPVIVTVIGVCVLRITWLNTIFLIPKFHSPFTVFLSYPISWLITLIVLFICFLKILKEKAH